MIVCCVCSLVNYGVLLCCREVVERGVPVLLSPERRSIEQMNLADRLQVHSCQSGSQPHILYSTRNPSVSDAEALN